MDVVWIHFRFSTLLESTHPNQNISVTIFQDESIDLGYREVFFSCIIFWLLCGKMFSILLFSEKTYLYSKLLQFISLGQGKLQAFFLIFFTDGSFEFPYFMPVLRKAFLIIRDITVILENVGKFSVSFCVEHTELNNSFCLLCKFAETIEC